MTWLIGSSTVKCCMTCGGEWAFLQGHAGTEVHMHNWALWYQGSVHKTGCTLAQTKTWAVHWGQTKQNWTSGRENLKILCNYAGFLRWEYWDYFAFAAVTDSNFSKQFFFSSLWRRTSTHGFILFILIWFIYKWLLTLFSHLQATVQYLCRTVWKGVNVWIELKLIFRPDSPEWLTQIRQSVTIHSSSQLIEFCWNECCTVNLKNPTRITEFSLRE